MTEKSKIEITTETGSENLTDSGLFDEVVPGVKKDLLPYAETEISKKEVVNQYMSEIDLNDSQSIIFYGSKAQEQLTTISDRMLEGVKNKDIGSAGKDLNEMVAALRGFDTDELDPNQKQSFFARLFGKAKPITLFLQRYEEVRKQIDDITDKLEDHKTTLLTDITTLDRLYDANLDYFHALEDYIIAGEEKLGQLDGEVIPAHQQQVDNSEEVIDAQKLRDLRSSRDDLERRVHDLRLTRQVAMQSLPGIRLVQENDKGLVNKITSTIINTIPLWRQQLATAVTIYRSSQAADTVKSATDLTNQLLEANADNLQQANAETRKQLERGVFDIESINKANRTLIDTIEESLLIADEGKRKRAEALIELQQCESELRKTLASSSSSRTTGSDSV